jgi:energy-coupling factor transporter ATP-binding protein EcfA2
MARQTAYVFQHPDQQLFARSVAAEVAFAPRLRGLPEVEAQDLVQAALGRTGLESVAEEHPYDLPPAQRKLVALAAALAQQPQVLVLDEPTQGLDRGSLARVIDVVRGLATEGVAVLAATHDLPFVVEALDRSVVLVEGELQHDGGSRELIWDETHSRRLGLEPPTAVQLSRALDLSGKPVRADEVARALAPLVK